MFKLAKNRRIQWPVTIAVPQDGGTVQKHKITVEFDILPQSAIDQLMQETRTNEQDAALLCEVLVGWDGVVNEDSQPLEFSPEACRDLVDISYARNALLRAYFEAASGSAAARKN